MDWEDGQTISVRIVHTSALVESTPNIPATGSPTISGTAQVGRTLSADTSDIADEDGLTNVSYRYRWIANDGTADTDLQDSTASTYTPSVSIVGKTIKVRVTFTDDADNQESLTSTDTDTVAATKPGVPGHLNALPHDAGALDVYWEAPASDGGSDITGYKVQWKESADSWDTETDVSETTVTGTTHTITSLTGGVEYAVRVIATNVAGDGPASTEARATPADSPASGEEGAETGESDSTAAWTATLTVGVSGSGSEAAWGYSWFLDGIGTLDKRTYNEGDQTIEVMAILLSNGFVAFNVRPHPSVNFVLTADGTEFASADASEVKSQTLISYVWATTLDWAEDHRVSLSLTLKDTDSAKQSEPAENTAPTGLPTISGTPQVGQDLTADTSAISDADGLDNVDYSYQWIGSNGNSDTDIEDATDSTYTPSSGDVGKIIKVKVKVSFTDDADNDETLTSEATVAVAATVPSAPQSLTVTSGSQIQELDASWQAPSSNGGSAVTGYKVQWKESTDSWDTADDVSEATETGTTHTITGLTGGVEYAVRVIASNDVGDGPASTEVKGTPAGGVSEQTVEPENSAPTGLPSISGTPQVDQSLTASTSNIDDEDGLTSVSYRYQWSAGGSDIEEATGSSYTLTYSEQGQTIQVQVSFTDGANNEETLTSQATVAVAAAPNREATGKPTIGGAPQVDQTLTADTSAIDDEDGLTNATFAYQWRGGGLTIIGATGSTYTLTASDQGKSITVRVRFTDDRNNIESRTSNATTAVAAAPNREATGKPTIGGTPQVGETLTADTANIADEDGLSNVSYRYQWLAAGSNINGATGTGYTVTESQQGKTIQVRVEFTDDSGNDESLTSAATETVAAKPTPLTASFANVPADHNGENFTFDLNFSENVEAGYVRMRDQAFAVTGGTIASATRKTQGSNQGWTVEVDPTGNSSVSITLPETTDCDASGAICTDDSRKLSHPTSATVAGPPAISVSDATVQEAQGAVLAVHRKPQPGIDEDHHRGLRHL